MYLSPYLILLVYKISLYIIMISSHCNIQKQSNMPFVTLLPFSFFFLLSVFLCFSLSLSLCFSLFLVLLLLLSGGVWEKALWLPSIAVFPQDCSGNLGSLCYHKDFQVSFPMYVSNLIGILMPFVLSLWFACGNISIFMIFCPWAYEFFLMSSSFSFLLF